jgi:putative protease
LRIRAYFERTELTRDDFRQVNALLSQESCEYVYLPAQSLCEYSDWREKSRIIAVLPAFVADETRIARQLDLLKQAGFIRAAANNYGHIPLIQDAGMILHIGWRLNVTNSAALEYYKEINAADVILSVEMPLPKIQRMQPPLPIGGIIYGKIPTMLLRRCPLADGKPCGKSAGGKAKCPRVLRDGKGVSTILCNEDYVEVLNCPPIILSDKLSELNCLDFGVILITDERDLTCISDDYMNERKPGGDFTRGLMFKQVE